MFCCRASCVEVVDPGPIPDKTHIRRNIEMRVNGGFVRFDKAPRHHNHGGYTDIGADKFLNINMVDSNGKIKTVSTNRNKDMVTANGKIDMGNGKIHTNNTNGKLNGVVANGRMDIDANRTVLRPVVNQGFTHIPNDVPPHIQRPVHVRNGGVGMLPAQDYALNRQSPVYVKSNPQIVPAPRQHYAIRNTRPISRSTSLQQPIYVRHQLVNTFYNNLTNAGQQQYAPIRKLAHTYEPLKTHIDRRRMERSSNSGLKDIVEAEKDGSFSEEQKHALDQLDDALDGHFIGQSDDETPVIVASVLPQKQQARNTPTLIININETSTNSDEDSGNSESEIIKERSVKAAKKQEYRKSGSVSFNLPDDYVDKPYTPLQPTKSKMPNTPPVKTEIRISGGNGTFWHTDDEIVEDHSLSKTKPGQFKGSFKNKFYGKYSTDDMTVTSNKVAQPENGVLRTIESFENLNSDSKKTIPLYNGSITRRNMMTADRPKSTSSVP